MDFSLRLYLTTLLLLISAPAYATTINPTGSTIEIGRIQYFLPGKPSFSLPSTLYSQTFNAGGGYEAYLPVTVVNSGSSSLTISELRGTIQTFEDTDDVWSSAFLPSKFADTIE